MYKLEPHFQLIRLILALVCCDCLLYCSIFLTIQFHLQGVQYTHWAPALRRFWKQGLNRVYAFWFVFVAMTIVVSTAISTDYVNWDKLNRDFVASNELSRAFLASFILVMDLMIVMQVNFTNSLPWLVKFACPNQVT